MSPKPLTLKVVQWLLAFLSAVGIVSALIVLPYSGAIRSVETADLTTRAAVQIVLNGFVLIGAVGVFLTKKWGLWLSVSVLALGIGMSLTPPFNPANVANAFVELLLIVFLVKERKYFDDVAAARASGASTRLKTSRASP